MARVTRSCYLLILVCSLGISAPVSVAQSPVQESPAIERKVDSMLSKLTLEQKVDLIGGEDSMYIRAIPAIGLPRLKMSDGPVGISTSGAATAYTGGMALAATWDPSLARRMGESIGNDARARGVHFLLGPGVNIYRAPMNGRNFEYFGEDPYLASHTAVPYIEGVQSRGVVATVKHFALNNQEWDRNNVSSDADEQTIREIYLPAFEAAVRIAHSGAVMDSYNLINGIHATQNDWLNNQILKEEWGFDGILMSDWGATHDGIAAANGGLDLEMPGAGFMNKETLLPAIREGKVTEATIDDKVRRILRTAIRFGFVDHEQQDLSIPYFNPEGREVALEEARESIVLLKNEGNLLPLDPNKVHTIALIGPDAWPAIPGGGGSSNVTAYEPVSLLGGLSAASGNVTVLYARGLPSLNELIHGTRFDHGVTVDSFDNPDFNGKPTTAASLRLDSLTYRGWLPKAEKPKSLRYTAEYTPSTTGNYLFIVASSGLDSYTLAVNGKQIIQQPMYEGQAPRVTELPLKAGNSIRIILDYKPYSSEISIGLGIRAKDELISSEARKIAAMADVAVVAAGFDPSTESETFDRSYALPWGQDALIEAVNAANKNTIVTLTAGGGVDTHLWIDKVPALLHNWYPGQEGGTAFAEILFGRRSPEGKLPFSFERTWEENPVHDNYYAPSTPVGQTPHVKYSEGVFLGYRYYTTSGKKPLFPFGFGLSYTTFSFSNLQVTPATTAASGSVNVSFDVTNTGQRAGADVAQLYIGDPSAHIKRPTKELKGYEKVRLEPGQRQKVTLTLDKRSFAYWDQQAHNWRVDPGQFTISIGDASDTTLLSQTLTVSE